MAAHGTMAEPPVPSTSVIQRALDFERPRTGPDDPMDIIQDASNCLGARPNTAPRPATEIREVDTKAIRLVKHLTGMVERSDALN